MQAHAKKTFVQDSWQTPRNARTLAAYMALQNREIGERIAALRKAKGNPPQEIVAQRLEISNRSYQSWEAGDTKPSWRNLTKLSKYYGVSEEFILLGDIADSGIPDESQLDQIQRAIAEQTEKITQLEELIQELLREIVVREREASPRTDATDKPAAAPRSRQRR